MEEDGGGGVWPEEWHGVGGEVGVECELVEGFVVHEDEAVAFVVEVLGGASVEGGAFDIVGGAESFIDVTGAFDIFGFDLDIGGALAGLGEVDFGDDEELAVEGDGVAGFEV